MVQYWYSKFAWQGPTPAEVGDAIIDKVIQLIIQQGKLMPGALKALQLAQSLNLPTALATSSNHRMMLATLQHFDLLHYFQLKSWSDFGQKIPSLIFWIFTLFLTVVSIPKKLSLIPSLGLLSCLYMMSEIPLQNWIYFGIWLLIGLVIYFTYSRKHSKLNPSNT